MISILLLAAALIDHPPYRELKVGDVIQLTAPTKEPVRPSPQSVTPAPAPVPAPPVAYGDAYGFGPWLNAHRAARGLRPLACDAGLCYDAAVNSAKGFGHSFLGRARRQNAGMGPASSCWPAWVASGPHAAALFDPTITAYGIANVNGVWTYSAR